MREKQRNEIFNWKHKRDRRRNIRFVKKKNKEKKEQGFGSGQKKSNNQVTCREFLFEKKRTNPNSVILTYKIPPSG